MFNTSYKYKVDKEYQKVESIPSERESSPSERESEVENVENINVKVHQQETKETQTEHEEECECEEEECECEEEECECDEEYECEENVVVENESEEYDNRLSLLYKGVHSKFEVNYDYVELELTPKVFLVLVSRITGMVMVVNYYMGTSTDFENMTFTNKVYNLTLPSVLGYVFGEYIVKGLVLYYMYQMSVNNK
jgi:hypothetical protein